MRNSLAIVSAMIIVLVSCLSAPACAQRFPMTDVRPNDTSPEIVQVVYQMTKDVIELCKSRNIPVWAEGGTLLGTVREKGLIRWDDDGDFGLSSRHLASFYSLAPTLDQLGYGMYVTHTSVKVFPHSGLPSVDKRAFRYPFLDFFISTTSSDNFVATTRGPLQHCYFLIADLFPLQNCEYGPIRIPCAHTPEPYLNRCYGRKGDWRKYAFMGYDHKNEAFRKVELFTLPTDGADGLNRVVPKDPLENRTAKYV